MNRPLKERPYLAAFIGSVAFFMLLFMYRAPLFILNDDVAIESILSGAYSGTPDMHTVYMGAGLSFVLSLLYRLIPVIPWFGVFCIIVVVLSAAAAIKKNEIAGAVMLLAFFMNCVLMPHYTVVAACAGSAGLLLLCGSSRKEDVADIWMAFILLILCHQIRMQVFYMLLPFLLPVMISRFIKDKAEEERGKFIPAAACLLVFLLLLAAQKLAYSGEDWKEYLKLNDARTELYDYTSVWESDEARQYYAGLGVSEEAFPIYKNYDLAVDDEADTERLHAMAQYREKGRQSEGVQRIKEALYMVKISFIPGFDDPGMPYAYVFWLMTIAVLVLSVMEKDVRALLSALACAAVHLALYAFLAYRGRMPERIVTSLYMADIAVMSILLLGKRSQKYNRPALIILTAVCIPAFIYTAKTVIDAGDYESQLAVNKDDDVLYSYMDEHPDELFLLETYATVNRTKYVLRARQSEPFNCMLMGGWLYGSPLQKQKLAAFGYDSAAEAVELGRGVEFAFRYDKGLDPEEMQSFLEAKKVPVYLQLSELLEGEREYFGIFTPVRY